MSIKTKQLTGHNYLRDYILCISTVIHNKTLSLFEIPLLSSIIYDFQVYLIL